MNRKELKVQAKAEKNDAEKSSPEKTSPEKPASKTLMPFFTNQKELKVQSAGAGHKGADYSPDKKNYHPIDDAFWKYGEK